MSERVLPNLTNTPPNGWRYRVPHTNHLVGPYSGWPQLRDNIAAHYRAAAYELPPDLFDKVHAYICEQEPNYCGDPVTAPAGHDYLAATKHTFHAAIQCLRTLVSHRAGSGERPTDAQQEQRAQVCAACPENSPIQQCSVCSWATLKGLVEKLAGARPTTVDAKLQFCGVCHCSTKAKVATKHDAIWKFMSEGQKQRLPAPCWIKTEAAPPTPTP